MRGLVTDLSREVNTQEGFCIKVVGAFQSFFWKIAELHEGWDCIFLRSWAWERRVLSEVYLEQAFKYFHEKAPCSTGLYIRLWPVHPTKLTFPSTIRWRKYSLNFFLPFSSHVAPTDQIKANMNQGSISSPAWSMLSWSTVKPCVRKEN